MRKQLNNALSKLETLSYIHLRVLNKEKERVECNLAIYSY